MAGAGEVGAWKRGLRAAVGGALLSALAACGDHHLLATGDAAGPAATQGRALDGGVRTPPGASFDAGAPVAGSAGSRPAPARDAGAGRAFDAGATPIDAAARADAGLSLSRSVIDGVLRDSQDALRACVLRPSCQAGVLDVRYIVTNTGSVRTAIVTRSSFDSSAVSLCAARTFRSLLFPAFDGPELELEFTLASSCRDDDAGT